METCTTDNHYLDHSLQAPHSLGKLIEWKLKMIGIVVGLGWDWFFAPHSLGKLIEWKHDCAIDGSRLPSQ